MSLQGTMSAFLQLIGAWTAYEVNIPLPDVVIHTDQLNSCLGYQPDLGTSTVACYDHSDMTIEVAPSFSIDNPLNRGTLFHELVHHVQRHNGNTRWNCHAVDEVEAYRLESKFYKHEGLPYTQNVSQFRKEARKCPTKVRKFSDKQIAVFDLSHSINFNGLSEINEMEDFIPLAKSRMDELFQAPDVMAPHYELAPRSEVDALFGSAGMKIHANLHERRNTVIAVDGKFNTANPMHRSWLLIEIVKAIQLQQGRWRLSANPCTPLLMMEAHVVQNTYLRTLGLPDLRIFEWKNRQGAEQQCPDALKAWFEKYDKPTDASDEAVASN